MTIFVFRRTKPTFTLYVNMPVFYLEIRGSTIGHVESTGNVSRVATRSPFSNLECRLIKVGTGCAVVMGMTTQEINAKITAAEHELNVREIAAGHLSGIPARQNATAISVLYDKLNHLHIARIEAAA